MTGFLSILKVYCLAELFKLQCQDNLMNITMSQHQ